jgi:hypothetical protein
MLENNAVPVRNLISEIFHAFTSDRPDEAITNLSLLTTPRYQDGGGLPLVFIEATIAALRSGHWESVGELFRNYGFIGRNGLFLVLGPLTAVRQGHPSTRLSGVLGQQISSPDVSGLRESSNRLLGQDLIDLVEILPFHSLESLGLASGDEGEAFLVPDGWSFAGPQGGPALNNMTRQRERFRRFATITIPEIFEPESATLLLNSLEDDGEGISNQCREFAFHEAGHATGIGLRKKLSDNLLSSTWYRAVEEWRADGLEFCFLIDTLSHEDAGRTIAANLCLRFGSDVHREGGVQRDTDVMATLITLDALLHGRGLKIGPNRKLEFRDPSFRGLVAATEEHRRAALNLTKDEMELDHPEGIWSLYGSIPIDIETRTILEGLVLQPCRNLVHGLA